MPRVGRLPQRAVFALGGVVLGDLVVGLTASSSLMLGSLWICSVRWLTAVVQFAGRGLALGDSLQLALACIGATATIPALVGTLYLSTQALRLPVSLLRSPARH